MKPATYPEEAQIAAPRLMTKATPDEADDPSRLRIALVTISWAGPGATSSRFLISESVTDSPIRPRTDTRTSSVGKIERMPKYVRAAAQTPSLSSLNALTVRLSASTQDLPERSVTPSGAVPLAAPAVSMVVLLYTESARGTLLRPPASRRYWCTNAMAMLPSPTAAATRLTGAYRTSPHAKIPGTLVSSRYGSRSSAQRPV